MGHGRLLGEGRTAEVHEYGTDRVVKLLRPEFDPELLDVEGATHRAAVEAGAPAPGIHGKVFIGGRPGIVFDRVLGKSLLDLILDSPGRANHWAELMARTHARILEIEISDLENVRSSLRSRIATAPGLGNRQRRQVLEVLDTLPDGGRLLHGDLHPSNVFVDRQRKAVIDWGNACVGSPAADVARSLHLISPVAIPPDFPNREAISGSLNKFGDIYRRTVIGISEIQDDDVERWMIPILAARLAEGIEWEREPILERLESLIR